MRRWGAAIPTNRRLETVSFREVKKRDVHRWNVPLGINEKEVGFQYYWRR